MKKISGILPSNARIASVDLGASAAGRPGTPGFGRKVGASSLNNKGGLSTAQKAVAIHKAVEANRAASRNVAIANRVSDKFFASRLNKPPVEQQIHNDPNVQIATQHYENTVGSVQQQPLEGVQVGPLVEAQEEPAPAPEAVATQQPIELNREDDMDAPEIGRYLDVAV